MKYKEFSDIFNPAGKWASLGLDKPPNLSLSFIDSKELLEDLHLLFPALNSRDRAYANGQPFVRLHGIDVFMDPCDQEMDHETDDDWGPEWGDDDEDGWGQDEMF